MIAGQTCIEICGSRECASVGDQRLLCLLAFHDVVLCVMPAPFVTIDETHYANIKGIQNGQDSWRSIMEACCAFQRRV
jgi:hypothetical protein